MFWNDSSDKVVGSVASKDAVLEHKELPAVHWIQLFIYQSHHQDCYSACVIIREMCSLHNLLENVMTCFLRWKKHTSCSLNSYLSVFFHSKRTGLSPLVFKASLFYRSMIDFFPILRIFLLFYNVSFKIFSFRILLILYSFRPFIDPQLFSKVNHLKLLGNRDSIFKICKSSALNFRGFPRFFLSNSKSGWCQF